MDGLFGKGAAIALGAPVGDEVNRDAALCQRRRERFGRKQMTARTAGRHQHRRPARRQHQAVLPPCAPSTIWPGSCARGRSRVSATSMPMP